MRRLAVLLVVASSFFIGSWGKTFYAPEVIINRVESSRGSVWSAIVVYKSKGGRVMPSLLLKFMGEEDEGKGVIRVSNELAFLIEVGDPMVEIPKGVVMIKSASGWNRVDMEVPQDLSDDSAILRAFEEALNSAVLE